MSDMARFLLAMGGDWRVERYSLDEGDRLRLHYRSMVDSEVTWSHAPFGGLETIPPVGTIGRIGFTWTKTNKETSIGH